MSEVGFDNGFLPKEGLIFVDTCGPTFVSGDNVTVQEIERLEKFIPILKNRGRVLTSSLVMGEMANSVKYFENDEARTRYGDLARRGAVAYKGLMDILKEGHKNACLSRGTDSCWDEIHHFYSVVRDGTHGPENQLLSDATFFYKFNRGNGILTADGEAIRAFVAGLKSFGVKGFVCDSRMDRAFFVG